MFKVHENQQKKYIQHRNILVYSKHMCVYFGEHVDGGPLTPPVHVNLALNASAFKNMSVDVGLSGRIHPEISWSKDDAPLNMS